MNILVVDDEKAFVKGLKLNLIQEGFDVLTAYDGMEAIKILSTEEVDFIILDLMLPEIDGFTLCKRIRSKMDIPIIMLTAKDDYVDKIFGLEYGADDYMTKPFHTRELIARIKAVYRRFIKTDEDKNIVQIDELKLNRLEKVLYKSNTEITLTSKEFDILEKLMTNLGRVYSRDELYRLVWKEDIFDTRTVDVHIRNLREKLENEPSDPDYIKTKWGLGYYFKKGKI